jgi:redox-sensitive bicupin YhaK (pirin superfamily)
MWVALPKSHEKTEPSFTHHPKATLPYVTSPGVRLHVIIGSVDGQTSPVQTFSPMFYVAGELDAGAVLAVPREHEERAIYLIEGAVTADGQALSPGDMAVLAPGTDVRIEASSASRLMLLGGATLDGDRLVWWNFVASDPALIEEAKARWVGKQFGQVPGETEFIPLPS